MPTYPHRCPACAHAWDVVTTVADRDNHRGCPNCGGYGEREITVPNLDRSAAGDWNNVSYNPGLGCWTKSWKHGRDIAKARGLEEVGNEAPEKIHAKMERDREEKRAQRWADADRVKVYED